MSTLTRVVVAALVMSSWCGKAASLYVVERYRGQVWSFDAASGEGRVVASGLGEMIGVTADRTGRLFVSQFRGFVPASGTVALVDPVSGTFSSIEGTAEVFGLSTDPESNILYVGGYNTGDLYRLEETSPGMWTVSVEESFGWPNRISHALKDGNLLYVICQDTGVWVKNLTTGMVTFGVEIPTIPTILSKESGGHLIIGSEYDVLYRVDPSSWEVVRTYEGFGTPCGVTVDPSDNTVLVADPERGQVSRLDLISGAITVITDAPVEPWQIALVGDASEPLKFTEVMSATGSLRLEWKGGVGILVQQTQSLRNPEWETVPGTDDQSSLEVPLVGGSRFFRLIGP